MTARPDLLGLPCCRLCGRPIPLAERLLAVLGDGEPRTARALAMTLIGPDAAGSAVEGTLRMLRETGAVATDGRTRTDHHKTGVCLWRRAPEPVRSRVRTTAQALKPEPEPEPKPKPKPDLEKGITREEHEAHLRQGREIAERKAARRAWRW